MRYPRKWQLAVVCLLIFALLPTVAVRRGRAQAAGYTVTEVGTLGGLQSRGFGLNNGGSVVGDSWPTNSASNHPFFEDGGQLTDMGTFSGDSGTAFAINAGGEACGVAALSNGPKHPFVWTKDAGKTDIGTLGGQFAEANDINDSGVVVGTSETTPLIDRGFIWQQGAGMRVVTPFGGSSSSANGINNAGAVVGTAETSSGASHAYILNGATMTDLGTIGGTTSIAYAVNDGGDVVGFSDLPSNSASIPFHAFLWHDDNGNGANDSGEMKDLGTLGSGKFSIAYGVNSNGQVVGYSETIDSSFDTHAFIWSAASGIQDLNDLAAGSGWTLQEARGINDRGQIVGIGISPSGQTEAFLLTPPASSVSSVSGSGVYNGAATLTATLTGGGSPLSGKTVSFTFNGNPVGDVVTDSNGVATLTNVSLSGISSGTYQNAVGAVFAGAVGFAGSSGTGALTVGKASQVITFSPLADKIFGDADFTLSAAATSGLSVGFAASGPCTVSGNVAHITGIGLCTITASQSGDGNYNPAPDVPQTFQVTKASSTTTVTVASATFDGQPHAGTATVTGAGGLNQNLTLTYTGRNATSYNSTTPPTNAGDYTASATFGGDANHTGSSGSKDFQIAKANQTITVTTHAPSGAAFNSQFTVAATSGSGLPVSYSSSGACTNQGATFTMTGGTGTCTVKYDQGGGGNFNAAAQVIESVAAQKVGQTISFAALSNKSFGDPDFNVSATATSNLTVTFTASGQCTVSGNTVHITGAGSCTVNASQAGDGNYNAATSVGRQFTINKATAAISLSNLSQTYDGNPKSATATTNPPGKTVVITYGQNGHSVASAINAGSYDVTATINDNNYQGSASGTLVIGKASSTTSVTVASATFDGQPHAGTATATGAGGLNQNLTLTYTGRNATSYNSTTPPTNAGDYTASATFGGDANHTGSSGSKDFQIAKANQTITVTTHAPSGAAFNSQFTVAATSGSGLPVSYSSSGACTNQGATFTMTGGTGTCTVKYDQGGGGNFNAAAQVIELVAAQKVGQTITFAALSNKSFGNPNFDVSASASSGLTVTFAATGNCSVSASTVHLTGAGSCTITASQAGDSNFPPASVAQSFQIAKAVSATAVSSSANPSAFGQSLTFTANVTSTAGTPTGTVQFKSDGVSVGTPATLNASGVATLATSALPAGTHTITAEYGGDSNFAASAASLPAAQVVGGIFNFSQSLYNVAESANFVTVTVTRTGDASVPVAVDYATSDGTATAHDDYTTALGTLHFAAGDTSESFVVLITDDGLQEPAETINVSLSNPAGGATLGAGSTATVVIAASDNPQPQSNPIDDSSEFVRQHYHDFLNREPDASGLQFWVNNIESCGSDAQCREVKRVNTSAAFFLSIEFQQTGYLVERTYKTAFGDATSTSALGGTHPLPVPVVRLNEFLADTQRIGLGVVVGQGNWEQQLEDNKNAFALEFVQRPRFTNAFPTTETPAQFVGALYANTGITPSANERNTAIGEFGASATDTSNTAARAKALRDVAENASFSSAEFNRAFVLMQFFGYLRRDPNAAPDTDYTGYDFWLQKLNQFGGNFQSAEMVKAFLSSTEYRNRFGQQ